MSYLITYLTKDRAVNMARRTQHSGRGGCDSRSLSIALAVVAGLLSPQATDSFLYAPAVGGGGASASAGLHRSAGEARWTQQAAVTGRRGSRREGSDGAALQRLSATGVATEDNPGAAGSLLETQKEVSNNDMRPIVVKPRRDPRVWFDAIRDAAAPRPESLAELSK